QVRQRDQPAHAVSPDEPWQPLGIEGVPEVRSVVTQDVEQVVGVLLEALDVTRNPAAAALALMIGAEHHGAELVELARDLVVARDVLALPVDEAHDELRLAGGLPQLAVEIDPVAVLQLAGLAAGLAHAG